MIPLKIGHEQIADHIAVVTMGDGKRAFTRR